MAKKEEDLKKLRDILLEGPQTVTDLKEKTTWSERKIKTYIGSLKKDLAYNIESKKIDGHYFYVLTANENDSANSLEEEPITMDVLRKYSIVRALQEKFRPVQGQDITDLEKEFLLKNSLGDSETNDKISLDISSTKFRELCDELIQAGDIITTNTANGGKGFFLTGKNIPLTIRFSPSELANLFEDLQNITPGMVYYKHLNDLRNKLRTIYDPEAIDEFSNNYIVFGQEYLGLSNPPQQLKYLRDIDYKNHCINVTYKTRKGYPRTVLLAVGLVVYSVEKDKFYILGDVIGMEKTEYDRTIIPVSNIDSITKSDKPNQVFQSKSYMKLFKQMFSVSIDKPVDVVVKFRYTKGGPKIKKKINYLHTLRKDRTQLREEPEPPTEYIDGEFVVTYTDTISGLADFKKFLRKLGRVVEVIQPISLKEEMLWGVERSLKRYEEEENNAKQSI